MLATNGVRDRLREMLTGRPRHQDIAALTEIDLDVSHGEVLGIVGRNGAGKSTLLKIIAGLLPPSDGIVQVNGRVAAILELGAAFHPEMSGRENVYLQAAIAGLQRAEIDARFPEIAAFAEIGDFIERPGKTYSSGMSARLAFAVATAIDPDILIIDDALSVGDGAFARKSFERIMAFRDRGKTILSCSHSAYQVEAICDPVLWLDGGRLRLLGPRSTVLSAYQAVLYSDAPASGEASTPRADATCDAAPPVSATGRILKVTLSSEHATGRPLVPRSGCSYLVVAVRFQLDPALPMPGLALIIAAADGRPIRSAQ